MAKGLDSAVAPKERINIVYQPATGGRKEQIELPLKVMVLGDFHGRKDSRLSDNRDLLDNGCQVVDGRSHHTVYHCHRQWQEQYKCATYHLTLARA